MSDEALPVYFKDGQYYAITDTEAFYERTLKGNARDFVGNKGYIERSSFYLTIMMASGLTEESKVLDIGCGCLNLGRILIPILKSGHYFGIEPNKWLIQEGFNTDVGFDIIPRKRPKFSLNNEMNLQVFGEKFDFIIAHSIFSHAPVRHLTKCLEEVKEVLKPGGSFFMSYVDSENAQMKEFIHDTLWIYPGIYAYHKATMQKYVDESGLHYQMFRNLLTPDEQKLLRIGHKP